MKKLNFLSILVICILFVALIVIWVNGISLNNLSSQITHQYTATINIPAKTNSPLTVQIYKGLWTSTGGNTIYQNGKLFGPNVNYVTQKLTDPSGKTSFTLPAGDYFVFVPDNVTALDDNVPLSFALQKDTEITIGK